MGDRLYPSVVTTALHITLILDNSSVVKFYFEIFVAGTTFALLVDAYWEEKKKAKGFRRLKWRARGLGG